MKKLVFPAVLLALALPQSIPAQNASIHRYTKPGFASVNSYLIETENGVVLIDSQRVLSQGRMLADRIGELGKPLIAVLLTHPHPDHFGGLAAVLDAFPDTPVFASAATLEEMRTDGSGFMAATRKVAPDDSPDVFPLPTATFDDGETLTFDGLRIVVDELGAGEAETMTAFYLPDHGALFVGDVVAYRMIGFLLEGRSEEWMTQIRRVVAGYGELNPLTYPGHGDAGPFATLMSWQLGQLAVFRALVAESAADGMVSDDERSAIKAEMTLLYPDHPYVAEIPGLMELNIDAVASELASTPEDTRR